MSLYKIRWVRITLSRFSSTFARNDLHTILLAAANTTDLPSRLMWFESLLEWAKLPVNPDKKAQTEHIQAARLKFLEQFLDRYPEIKENVSINIEQILFELNPATVLSDAGIEVEHSFGRELFERILYSVIVRPHTERDLRFLFEMIFKSEEDANWYAALTEENNRLIGKLFFKDVSSQAKYEQSLIFATKCALNTLCIRLMSLYITREVQERLPEPDFQLSSFYKLQRLFANAHDIQFTDHLFTEISQDTDECLLTVQKIYSELEKSGVSIDLVYKLECMRAIIRRMHLLLRFLIESESAGVSARYLSNTIGQIARDSIENKSLRSFIGSNINLIARKIVERTSETGEHYITRDKSEYKAMFKSAAGGGLLTVGTTLLKASIGRLGLPMFIEGIFMSLNYSISFIIIQLSGLTLATKTPAMTASTMAARLKNMQGPEDLTLFVEEVVCLVRSAFIAVVGNVGVVIPGAIVVDLIQYQLSGSHILTDAESLYNFKSHNPFTSMTLLYACITGFILWFSSVFGGWADNWFVYYKQFDVLDRSQTVAKLIGTSGHRWFCQFARRNFAAFASNISLGLMLAFCGIWGKFFGLPLQVRHVTLSAGALAFAAVGLKSPSEHIVLIIGALFGIIVIGLLNFAVSFSLSLFVAARARNIRLNQFPGLLSAILKRFLSAPKDFFISR